VVHMSARRDPRQTIGRHPSPGSPPRPALPHHRQSWAGPHAGQGTRSGKGRHPPYTNEQRPDEHDVVALPHPIQHDSLRRHVAQV
jgi:hypothetical protein